MKNQYVVLTGAKSNAGDFLIKKAVDQSLRTYRPDRSLVHLDRWKPLTSKEIEVINESKALILAGGPAINSNMYPAIYPLTPNLNDIKIPIITFGIGWKSTNLNAKNQCRFSAPTHLLLEKIKRTGILSSVRDEGSNQILKSHNYKNFITTGCPVLFLPHKKLTNAKHSIKNIVFSLPGSALQSKALNQQVKEHIIITKDYFNKAEITLAFHHPIDKDIFTKLHPNNNDFFEAQNNIRIWAQKENINFIDISQSAEKMIDLYADTDFHVGYRLHAHILMSGMNKLSCLITEDSRGEDFSNLIWETSLRLDTLTGFKNITRFEKLIRKLKHRFDKKKNEDIKPSSRTKKNSIGDFLDTFLTNKDSILTKKSTKIKTLQETFKQTILQFP